MVYVSTEHPPRLTLYECCLQESRHVQQIQLKLAPVQLSYSPDGKTILYTTTNRNLGVLRFGKEGEEAKEQWRVADTNGVCFPYAEATVYNAHSLY